MLGSVDAPASNSSLALSSSANGAATPPAVSVEGLVKRYGELEAVRGIDFTVAAGETFGFLGPNGAGKSTTINMLCTLVRPSGGAARVAGHDVVGERDEVRRNIGLVFQDTTLDGYLSAEQNLRLHAELYGVPRDAVTERLRQVMEMVGLWERRASLVMTFSGGMKRRLEIARGLLHSPRVLFLDEPTVGLDPQTRNSIWSYISELKRDEDITIFLTTHYMDEAEYCDRIAIMDRGTIVALDTPRGAEGGRRQGSRADPDARRRGRDRRPARALRDRGDRRRRRRHVRRARRRAVRPAPVRRARPADPVGQRLASLPRRRVHVLHRHHHPRRRGVRHERHEPQHRPHDEPVSGVCTGEVSWGRTRCMATETTRPPRPIGPPAAAPGGSPTHHLARVRVPARSWRGELRAIRVVWKRELIRFGRDRLRILTSLIQPFLFLFVLGTGISTLASAGTHGVNFKTFIYPGVLCMAVMFTAMFSAASIVWDREFGFLREMMVAPVRRSSIVLGKVARRRHRRHASRA